MKTMVVISHPTVHSSSVQQFFLATVKGEETVTVRHLDEVWSEKKPHFIRARRKSVGRLRGRTPYSSIPDVLVPGTFSHEGMDRYGDE